MRCRSRSGHVIEHTSQQLVVGRIPTGRESSSKTIPPTLGFRDIVVAERGKERGCSTLG